MVWVATTDWQAVAIGSGDRATRVNHKPLSSRASFDFHAINFPAMYCFKIGISTAVVGSMAWFRPTLPGRMVFCAPKIHREFTERMLYTRSWWTERKPGTERRQIRFIDEAVRCIGLCLLPSHCAVSIVPCRIVFNQSVVYFFVRSWSMISVENRESTDMEQFSWRYSALPQT